MSSFYNYDELAQLGFKSYGSNVLISRNTCIYKPETIEIGDNVRIDDFCFLLGSIKISSNVHIAPYSNLVGGEAGIVMEDFSGLSSRVSVYAVTDDYSGAFMTNPTVPAEYTNVKSEKVVIKKHSIIGASSVILPGVTIGEGTSCGALSLINKSTESWSVNVGAPCKKIAERKKDIIELERKFISEKVKLSYEAEYIVSPDMIEKYADVSGDYNPIHLNEEYAKNTIFGERIAHGMLTASFISAIIGNQFPGNGTIYLSQNLRFLKPVKIGERIRVRVELIDISDKGNGWLSTCVYDEDDNCLLRGEAKVKLPSEFVEKVLRNPNRLGG